MIAATARVVGCATGRIIAASARFELGSDDLSVMFYNLAHVSAPFEISEQKELHDRDLTC
jgi:hypothetical protein